MANQENLKNKLNKSTSLSEYGANRYCSLVYNELKFTSTLFITFTQTLFLYRSKVKSQKSKLTEIDKKKLTLKTQ